MTCTCYIVIDRAEAAEADLSATVDELRATRLDLHTALLERGVAHQEVAEQCARTLDDAAVQRALDDLAELAVSPPEVSRLLVRLLLVRDAASARIAESLAVAR